MKTNSDYSIHKSIRLCLSQNNRLHAYTHDFFDSCLNAGNTVSYPITVYCSCPVKEFFQHVSEPFFHYFFTPAETRFHFHWLPPAT